MQDTARSTISNYRELPPPPELASYLTCVWIRITNTQSEILRPRIVPDGCIDIVWIGGTAPKVAGPATQPVIAQLPPCTTIVGARFRPGMAMSLLGIPASELRNLDVLLSDIWGPETDWLAEASSPETALDQRLIALRALMDAHLPEARYEDTAIQHAVTLLNREPATQVQELSRALDISSRQLRRRFSSAVGYGPKTFGRIVRFQRAIQTARQSEHMSSDLALLAATMGYADHAHMSREFTRLAGVPPSELLAAQSQPPRMSDSFKPPATSKR